MGKYEWLAKTLGWVIVWVVVLTAGWLIWHTIGIGLAMIAVVIAVGAAIGAGGTG